MNLSPQSSEDPDINLTPMIDVVFLLLLFFMVSTSFIRESSLKVNLPEATGEPMIVKEREHPIDIVIRADGQFLINGKALAIVNRDNLRTELRNAAGNNQNPHIIISADANAQYQHIVTAMDTAQQIGFNKLTLATRQTQAENE